MGTYKSCNDSIKIEAIQINNEKTIKLKNMIITGFPKSWLITPAEGEQFFMSDELFKKKYESVKKINLFSVASSN